MSLHSRFSVLYMEVRYNNDNVLIGVFATRYFRKLEPLIYVDWKKQMSTPMVSSIQVSESTFIETDVELVKYLRTSESPNLVLERQFFTPIQVIRPGEEMTFRFKDTKLK